MSFHFILTLMLTGVTSQFPHHLLRHLTADQLDVFRDKPEGVPFGTSTYHVTKLIHGEVAVVRQLNLLRQQLAKVLQQVDRYLTSWQDLEEAGVDKDNFSHHPLNSYAVIKHVSGGWNDLEETLLELNSSSHLSWLVERRSTMGVPTKVDLTSVSAGVARLHDFYQLNLTCLANAQLVSRLNVRPVVAGVKPNAWDFQLIGGEAAKMDIWNSAVDFMQAALYHYNISQISTGAQQSELKLETLQAKHDKVVVMHDRILERKGPRSKKHSTHDVPFNRTLARKKKYHQKPSVVLGVDATAVNSLSQYVALCRGEEIRPTSVTSLLVCRYVTNSSPQFVLSPMRMEVASTNPYIVTLDGFLREDETKSLMETGSEHLIVSSVFKTNGLNETNSARTSSTAWLWEHDNGHLPVITRRIESILNVNAKQNHGAEAYQVVNYGVGGHYSVHHDALLNGGLHNRFATFLIYMTDVLLGGATVFPRVGVAIKPKRGMAVLWFNVNANGDRDQRAEHGACPVLYGDKWVINKWMLYGEQFLHHPCGANPEEHFKFPLY